MCHRETEELIMLYLSFGQPVCDTVARKTSKRPGMDVILLNDSSAPHTVHRLLMVEVGLSLNVLSFKLA